MWPTGPALDPFLRFSEGRRDPTVSSARPVKCVWVSMYRLGNLDPVTA